MLGGDFFSAQLAVDDIDEDGTPGSDVRLPKRRLDDQKTRILCLRLRLGDRLDLIERAMRKKERALCPDLVFVLVISDKLATDSPTQPSVRLLPERTILAQKEGGLLRRIVEGRPCVELFTISASASLAEGENFRFGHVYLSPVNKK